MGTATQSNFNNTYKPNYSRFFSMVHHMASTLNSRKDRFDKADLIEAAIETHTGGILAWVDLEGHDNVCKLSGDKYEIKSQQHSLYTKTGNQKKKTTQIKLSNTLSQDPNAPFASDFDYLMLIDTGSPRSYSVAIISKEDLEPFMERKLDGWTAQIPTSELEFVCTPDQITLQADKSIVPYGHNKRELQRTYVRQF